MQTKGASRILINFENTAYLKNGNERQQAAYQVLTKHEVLSKLREFSPILVGTIPINIDTAGSDLDIICCCPDLQNFAEAVTKSFKHERKFSIAYSAHSGKDNVAASFFLDNFEVEVFGQSTPTKEQNAYRHMLIEHRILEQKGEDFRKQIVALKEQGVKTEPAFAQLLGVSGDPYSGLLDFERRYNW